MKCKHNHFIISLMIIITFIAVFLHMLSHFIPILITNKTAFMIIEPLLHNPIIVISAWSFLPLMIYHMWKDNKAHKEMHKIQEENIKLKNQVDIISINIKSI